MTDPRVATLVLAGGSGRRLWPLSHRERPKPLLDWLDGATMLDATLARTPPWCDPSRVFVSVPRESEGVFREALGAHPDVALLVEPEARDTGPALAWAMAEIEARVGPCVVLVVAADHAVRDVAALHAALKYGKLDALLQKGLCVVERAATLGRGSIGDYAIESDTVSDELLECMEGPARERLAGVLEHPTSDEVRRHKGGSLPLRNAADFLETTGEALRALLQRHANVDVRGETSVVCAQVCDGGFVVTVRTRDGATERFTTKALVSALGGEQRLDALFTVPIAPGVTLGDAPWRDRVRSSSRVLTAEGLRECDALLDGVSAPCIAIVGSSHSAVSCARVLVERLGSRLGEGSVSLLVRRAPRVFFPSREAAMADGYRDFGERDVRPTTGRVHRLGGLRLEARRFAMGVLGLGSEPAEPRVRLDLLSTMTPDAVRATLRSAHLVVGALGYRPRVVPLFDRAGAPVVLHSDEGARAAVDPWCRVLDARGVAIEDLYAIGLASGFVPWGAMGGEPGFVGQTNGVWLYQHHVGAMIVEQLLGEGRRAR